MGNRLKKFKKHANVHRDASIGMLATEIVLKAISDWQSLCLLEKEHRVDRGESVNFDELRRFFKSGYCDLLLHGTELSGEYILKELEDLREASQYGMSQTTWQKRRKAEKAIELL